LNLFDFILSTFHYKSEKEISLIQTKKGKESLTVIKIDSDFSSDLLAPLKSIEGVNNIYSVII
jgi:hypothetical protein